MMKNNSDFVILNSGYIGGYKLHVLEVRWMLNHWEVVEKHIDECDL
jgi:hypothetical protein